MLRVGCSLAVLKKQMHESSNLLEQQNKKKQSMRYSTGNVYKFKKEVYHQVGCHCIVSWPSGHLLAFQSGHLQFPGFFLTGHNELQPFLEFQIRQKVPIKNKQKTANPMKHPIHKSNI